MLAGLIAGAVGGLAGAGMKIASGISQKKAANKINPVWQQYRQNENAAKSLGITQQLFNGRMAGATDMERNILTNQSNAISGIQGAATDGSQALAMIAGTQGQANDAMGKLGIAEGQNKASLLDNLSRAYGVMIGEGDKEYMSLMDKYREDRQRKDALNASSAQNWSNAFNDIAGLGMSFAGMGKGGAGGGGGFLSGANGGGLLPK